MRASRRVRASSLATLLVRLVRATSPARTVFAFAVPIAIAALFAAEQVAAAEPLRTSRVGLAQEPAAPVAVPPITAPSVTETDVEQLVEDALAAEGDEAPLALTVSSPWPKVINHGWWPAFADVTNRSDSALEGTLEVRTWSRGGRIDVPFRVGPRQTTRIEIDLPAFYVQSRGVSDSSYTIQPRVRGLDDLRIHESVQRDSLLGVHSVVVATPRAIEGGIETAWAEQLKQDDVSSTSGPAHFSISASIGAGARVVRTAIPGAASGAKRTDVELAQVLYQDLPTRVAAYTSLELVILADAKQLPSDEQLAALLAWVRSGGRLALLGPEIVAAARRNADLAAWLEPRFRVAGESDRAAIHVCGLGWLALSDRSGSLAPEGAEIAKQVLSKYPSNAAAPEPGAGVTYTAPRTANWAPAIPGLDDVPMRAFIAVLFLFWILIGPVNFYVVSVRWKKPALLLVTIPLLALLFSVLLFGYGIADQGLSTRSATQSLSLLDQRSHRANSVDVRELFVGFSAGDGLRPGANTVVCPAPATKAGQDENYVVDARDGGALGGNFCPVRTAQLLQVQSERASRLRCDWNADGGAARFRNGLESEIEALLVRDASGQTWRATRAIAAGAEGELEQVVDNEQALREFDPSAQFQSLAFVKGSYLARVASNPLLDDCALGAREVSGTHVILGLFDAEATR